MWSRRVWMRRMISLGRSQILLSPCLTRRRGPYLVSTSLVSKITLSAALDVALEVLEVLPLLPLGPALELIGIGGNPPLKRGGSPTSR